MGLQKQLRKEKIKFIVEPQGYTLFPVVSTSILGLSSDCTYDAEGTVKNCNVSELDG